MTGKTTIDLLPEGTPTDQGQLVFNEGGLDQKVTKEDFFATEGFGTASKLDAQTSLTDTTPNRLMKVGAFGVGGFAGATSGNADDQRTPGTKIWVNSGATGKPSGTKSGLLITTTAPNSNTLCQLFYESATTDVEPPRIFFRQLNAVTGLWNSWVETYHTGNILGTVSQSGGVPTGAIIERGSNANGEYTKFADGTMICVAHTTVTNPACTPTGGGYQLANLFSITFPAPFIALTYKSTSTAEYISGINRSWVGNGPKSSGNRLAILFAFGDLSTTTTRVETIAIGRWF